MRRRGDLLEDIGRQIQRPPSLDLGLGFPAKELKRQTITPG
jgi:hypothetical protein